MIRRLHLMMFLEYAIRGSWSVLIAASMEQSGFSGQQIGMVFATFAVGALISPLITGWLADLHMRADRLFAACHLLGAVTLFGAWTSTEFMPLFLWILLHNLTFYPTVSLGNTICFHHLTDRNRYGNIRVWGTFGWIVINWAMSIWMWFDKGEHIQHCLLIGAILCLVGGLGSLWLPATPPSSVRESPVAILHAMRTRHDRRFAMLIWTGLGVGVGLAFVYNFTFLFFISETGLALSPAMGNMALTIGQVAEIGCFFGLAWLIAKVGIRRVLLLGIASLWIRLIVFAIGKPLPVVLIAQVLHGCDYAFFIAAGAIAVDLWLPGHQRARAQAFILLMVWGVGMLAGHLLSGWWYDHCSAGFAGQFNQVDWRSFWSLPALILTPFLVLFALIFPKDGDSTTRPAKDTP